MELPQTHWKQLESKLDRLPFSQNEIYSLVNKQSDLFPVFDLRYLAINSTNRHETFRQLLNSIEEFNKTLQEWHKGRVEISSIRTQYNIYSNLKTRLQTIVLIPSEDLLKKNLQQCLEWFEQVTTKKFKHNVDKLFETLRSTKQSKTFVSGEDEIYMMYKKMGRTQHGELPPPNERLVHYKKRQSVFPIQDLSATKQSFYSERKLTFFGMTSGKDTIQSTARDINTADVEEDDGVPLENEEQLEGISEGNQNESIAFENNLKKVYAGNSEDSEVKSKFGRAQLSGKLKLLNKQTNLTKKKLEEVHIVNEMNKWAKSKSRKESQFSRALEFQTRQATNGVQETRRRAVSMKSIKSMTLHRPHTDSAFNPELPPDTKPSLDLTKIGVSQKKLTFMDKIGDLNRDVKSERVRQAIKQNLKNIQHYPINEVRQTEEDARYTSQSSIRPKLGGKTLTSFMKKRSSSVANILQKNSPSVQNDFNIHIAEKIKQSLLKKGGYLGNKTIEGSLMQYIHQVDPQIQMYRSGQKLLSNPWFPKTKGKKKSKKRY